ncbi:deoxyguanosinetriphosphate triphosphohydrolase, partial [Escherichia coli]|nr:deoxyguanosinetriphosphate triphosphohydrolase [Escherichia coli]
KFTLPQPDSCIFEISKKRAVVDYISGMMDTFAVKEWETHCLK